MVALAILLVLGVEPKAPSEQLLTVKRVYVDRLGGGAPAETIRDLLIASLQSSQVVQITENEERADAFVRGSADLQIFTELHDNSEGITGRISLGRTRGGTSNANRTADNGSASISEHESSRVQERRQEAIVTVRIVLKNGDVVWSTTQESPGGKFRGASADVAEKVSRQLTADLERLRKSAPK
jgi:hypothetical protein